MYSEDELLPISALQHLLFCERRAALVCTEGLWKDNIFTAEGTLMHERTHLPGTESRDKLKIARNLWLRSLRLGICGKVDTVEFRLLEGNEEDQGIILAGETGHWQPFPVEYKRGHLRSEASFEIQLCAQALCLEEMLPIRINGGALYYGQTHRRLEIILDEAIRQKTEAATLRLHEIIQSGITPKAQFQAKCRSCSLCDICLPETMNGNKKVEEYIEHFIMPFEENL
jgi:CRISPR-associated exonuclease Cas4